MLRAADNQVRHPPSVPLHKNTERTLGTKAEQNTQRFYFYRWNMLHNFIALDNDNHSKLLKEDVWILLFKVQKLITGVKYEYKKSKHPSLQGYEENDRGVITHRGVY